MNRSRNPSENDELSVVAGRRRSEADDPFPDGDRAHDEADRDFADFHRHRAGEYALSFPDVPRSERHRRRPNTGHRRQLSGETESRPARLGRRRNLKPLRRYAVQADRAGRIFGTGGPLTSSSAARSRCTDEGVCKHDKRNRTESASRKGLSVF